MIAERETRRRSEAPRLGGRRRRDLVV